MFGCGENGNGNARPVPRPSINESLFDGVCRRLAPEGFEGVTKTAKKRVGPVTYSKKFMKVYVTFSKGFFYAATNYITEGERIPAKLTTKDKNICLHDVVNHLIGTKQGYLNYLDIEFDIDYSWIWYSSGYDCIYDELKKLNHLSVF